MMTTGAMAPDTSKGARVVARRATPTNAGNSAFYGLC